MLHPHSEPSPARICERSVTRGTICIRHDTSIPLRCLRGPLAISEYSKEDYHWASVRHFPADSTLTWKSIGILNCSIRPRTKDSVFAIYVHSCTRRHEDGVTLKHGTNDIYFICFWTALILRPQKLSSAFVYMYSGTSRCDDGVTLQQGTSYLSQGEKWIRNFTSYISNIFIHKYYFFCFWT